MKQPNVAQNRLKRLATGFAFFSSLILLAVRAQALEVIDPTGLVYSNITASSQFSTGFVPANLFNNDMTGIVTGGTVTGTEYAKSGGGTAYVAFQVDQIYSVGSIYFAQRNGSTTGDNIQKMSIWVSTNTPFATNDPGTTPAAVIAITPNIGTPVWTEYLLTNNISGQYFLLKMEQTTVTGNPGGSELRLGLAPPPLPPIVTQQPADKTIYVGGTAHFTVAESGPLPISYQWQKGSSVLSDGGRISGSTTPILAISGIGNGDADSYSCVMSNVYGTTNSAAAILTVVPAPTTAEAVKVLADGAAAYWQFSEASGTTNAVDFAGGYNGVYGVDSGLGSAGPQSPSFPGFAADNTSVQTLAFDTTSAVSLPALNLGGTNVTIMAWIKPDGSAGQQNPYTGIVFGRGAGTIAGLIYSTDGTQLAYQWAGNRFSFTSGLSIPNDQWSMVAIVVTATNATLFCGTNNMMRSITDTFGQTVQKFAGTTYVGLDPDTGESARTFNGAIDDVAFFNRALTETEIDGLYAAGAGALVALPVGIIAQPTNRDLFLGETLSLSVQASGTPPITYQWYKDNQAIAGATNTTYTYTGVTAANASPNYYAVISNSTGPVTSSVVAVTVSGNIMRVLDPKGAIYTQVQASSTFSAAFASTNLFATDVTGLAIGATMTTEGNNHEYARKGAGDAWVTFQLDQVYPVGALYWAQRVGSGTGDNMQVLNLYASQTTPFTTNDPGTNPDAVINLTPNSGNPVWTRYLLTNVISGRYFLMHLQQTTITGNPGGAEMRLAVTGAPEPISISNTSSGPALNWPTYGVLQQASSLNGPWTTVAGATNGIIVPPAGGQTFYRVKYY